MTDVFIAPEIDDLVRRYYQSRTEITDLITDRTYTIFPEGVEFPALRVTQFSTSQPVISWLDGNLLQIDAYAPTRSLASLLGRTARGVLHDLHGGFHDGVITGVSTAGWRYEPDPSYGTAKPRYLFTATIHAHPLPTIGS